MGRFLVRRDHSAVMEPDLGVGMEEFRAEVESRERKATSHILHTMQNRVDQGFPSFLYFSAFLGEREEIPMASHIISFSSSASLPWNTVMISAF